MSQKMINELTDTVSALRADVARLNRVASDMRGRALAAEAAGRELAQTAEGLLGENKRLRAEVRDLSSVLTDLLVDTKSFSRPIARQEVDDIRIEARNNIEP
jgi:regulator of replication initiation timing